MASGGDIDDKTNKFDPTNMGTAVRNVLLSFGLEAETHQGGGGVILPRLSTMRKITLGVWGLSFFFAASEL